MTAQFKKIKNQLGYLRRACLIARKVWLVGVMKEVGKKGNLAHVKGAETHYGYLIVLLQAVKEQVLPG